MEATIVMTTAAATAVTTRGVDEARHRSRWSGCTHSVVDSSNCSSNNPTTNDSSYSKRSPRSTTLAEAAAAAEAMVDMANDAKVRTTSLADCLPLRRTPCPSGRSEQHNQ